MSEIMSNHYGPEWSWDQTRPEAIEARRQMAEAHKSIIADQQRRQAIQEAQRILAGPAATHFLLAAKHLWLAAALGLRHLRTCPTFVMLNRGQASESKGGQLKMSRCPRDIFRDYDLQDLQSPGFSRLLRIAHAEGRLLILLSEVGLNPDLFSPRYRLTQSLRRGLRYLQVEVARILRRFSSRLIPFEPPVESSSER